MSPRDRACARTVAVAGPSHRLVRSLTASCLARPPSGYAAARQALIEQADGPNNGPRVRTWISRPETSDDAVAAATGRGWDQWIDMIERWDGDGDDHAAVARYLEVEHGLDGWWSQTVTVGFERITGRRLPHQRADGTFAVSKSATVDVAADRLRAMLLDDTDRADLFPGQATRRRSRPSRRRYASGSSPGWRQSVWRLSGTAVGRRVRPGRRSRSSTRNTPIRPQWTTGVATGRSG